MAKLKKGESSQIVFRDGRPWRRLVVAIFLAHIFLIHFAILPFITADFPGYRWPREQSIFIEGLAGSQVGLLAALLVVGSLPLPLRIGANAIVLAFWLTVLNYLDLGHEHWLLIFVIQIFGISLSLVVARSCGVRLINQYDAHEIEQGSGKYRFSLRQMLLWVAAVAFLLNLGIAIQHLWGLNQSIDLRILLRANALGLSFISVALVAIWAALGTNRKLVPLLIAVLITVIASLAVGRTDRLCRTSWWSSLTRETYEMAYWYLVSVYAVMMYLSSLGLKLCGYRMAKTSIQL